MISFWIMVLFLIGDSACSFSKKTAKEGSCVTVRLTLSKKKHSGYIVWLKDAEWNEKTKDLEGTIVHSLKPDKLAASEFENRVSVGSTGDLYKLTISNLRLEDSGKYLVRYYDEDDPSYKLGTSTMSLDVQENPCQVSVTGQELVQTGAEVILRCSTVGPCQDSPEWRSSGPGLASSKGSDTQGVKTAQLSFKADWSHDGVEFSCWPSLSNKACASRNITLAVEYAPKDVRATADPGGEVNEKTNLNLSCKAQSNPGVTAYAWFKLTGRGAEEVGQGPVLTIRNLLEEHTGQYLCRTRNKIGEGNSSVINVTVRYGPRKPVVIHNMTSRGRPVEGSAVALMCSSQSYPPIRSYEWHVQKDNAETLLRHGQNLTIGSDEEGIYYCTAENEISSSSSDPIEIRFDRSSTRILIMVTSCSFVIIIIIVIVILVYRLSRRLKGGRDSDTYASLQLSNMSPDYDVLQGGRDRDTYASLQLPNISPEYDVLQVKNKHQKDTGTTQDESDDYQNLEDGNRPDSGAN